jgi:FixJ family two-component response regulator
MTRPLPLIAVVDDEESMRLALARVLRGSSYAVSLYASGEEFLESLAASRPAGLVLDLHMPGLSGREVQQALVMAKVTLPIVVITAHDQPELRQQWLADGAVAYFTKPLRRESLISALDGAIRGSGSPTR